MIENSFVPPSETIRNAPSDVLYFTNYMRSWQRGAFYVESIGITEPNPEYRISRVRSGVKRFGIYVMEYVLDGRGYIECDGVKHTVEKGDFYFLGSNSSHVYYSDKEEPYRKLWVNLRGTLIDRLLEVYGINAQVIICHIDFRQFFEDMRRIYTEQGDTDLAERNIEASLKVAELIMRLDRHRREAETKVDLPMRMKLYIDNSVNFSLSVEQLARRFHMNSNYITSVFKQRYGITPKQYMLERKISCAKQLLSNSTCEIKEVSNTLAFSSVYHFANTFKRIAGETPSEYRRRASHGDGCGAREEQEEI